MIQIVYSTVLFQKRAALVLSITKTFVSAVKHRGVFVTKEWDSLCRPLYLGIMKDTSVALILLSIEKKYTRESCGTSNMKVHSCSPMSLL